MPGLRPPLPLGGLHPAPCPRSVSCCPRKIYVCGHRTRLVREPDSSPRVLCPDSVYPPTCMASRASFSCCLSGRSVEWLSSSWGCEGVVGHHRGAPAPTRHRPGTAAPQTDSGPPSRRGVPEPRGWRHRQRHGPSSQVTGGFTEEPKSVPHRHRPPPHPACLPTRRASSCSHGSQEARRQSSNVDPGRPPFLVCGSHVLCSHRFSR